MEYLCGSQKMQKQAIEISREVYHKISGISLEALRVGIRRKKYLAGSSTKTVRVPADELNELLETAARAADHTNPILEAKCERLEHSMKRLTAILKLVATEAAPASAKLMCW
jgi:hypothetical protein